MIHHSGSCSSVSSAAAPDLESGQARLPGLPVHYHPAAQAAQPLITARLGSHHLLQLHGPHHQPPSCSGGQLDQGQTHVLFCSSSWALRSPSHSLSAKGNVAPQTRHPLCRAPFSSQPVQSGPARVQPHPSQAPGGTQAQSRSLSGSREAPASSLPTLLTSLLRRVPAYSGCRGASPRGRPVRRPRRHRAYRATQHAALPLGPALQAACTRGPVKLLRAPLQQVAAQYPSVPVTIGLPPGHLQGVSGPLPPQMAPDKPGSTRSSFSLRPP
ncbi:hypothetical protein NDU88_004782 [Pleurodeles waltl]|uniref:Uncharacterized protein n=1 Tax=Pleurodeles waltl TaxID=8319 RepID=A0AAV7WWY5_PLEWA|nr:hypothetical protein NDU88_004782 [Pleurodeles waltl]